MDRGIDVAGFLPGCVLAATVAQARRSACPSGPLRLVLPVPPGGATVE